MGGAGSGNWGHAGRPGEVGGSGPGDGSFHEPSATLKGVDVKQGHLSTKMIQQIETQISEYNSMAPEAMSKIAAIGDRMDVLEAGYKSQLEDGVKAYMKDHPGADETEVRTKFHMAIQEQLARQRFAEGHTPGSTLISPDGITRIGISSRFETEEGKAELKSAVTRNFQPKGSGTLKSVIDHEIEHVMDRTYNISGDPQFQAALRKDIGPEADASKISRRLCEYASQSVVEFAACAWDEYKNNPKPRPMARKYGKLIEKIVAEKRETMKEGGSVGVSPISTPTIGGY